MTNEILKLASELKKWEFKQPFLSFCYFVPIILIPTSSQTLEKSHQILVTWVPILYSSVSKSERVILLCKMFAFQMGADSYGEELYPFRHVFKLYLGDQKNLHKL